MDSASSSTILTSDKPLTDTDTASSKLEAKMANGVEKTAHSGSSNDHSFIETLEHNAPGYAHDRNSDTVKELEDEYDEANNPNIHHKVHSNPTQQYNEPTL